MIILPDCRVPPNLSTKRISTPRAMAKTTIFCFFLCRFVTGDWGAGDVANGAGGGGAGDGDDGDDDDDSEVYGDFEDLQTG